MRFGILGALEVWSDTGVAVAVGAPRPRAVLFMLTANAGRVIAVDQLIAGQYGTRRPRTRRVRCRRRFPGSARRSQAFAAAYARGAAMSPGEATAALG